MGAIAGAAGGAAGASVGSKLNVQYRDMKKRMIVLKDKKKRAKTDAQKVAAQTQIDRLQTQMDKFRKRMKVSGAVGGALGGAIAG